MVWKEYCTFNHNMLTAHLPIAVEVVEHQADKSVADEVHQEFRMELGQGHQGPPPFLSPISRLVCHLGEGVWGCEERMHPAKSE